MGEIFWVKLVWENADRLIRPNLDRSTSKETEEPLSFVVTLYVLENSTPYKNVNYIFIRFICFSTSMDCLQKNFTVLQKDGKCCIIVSIIGIILVSL